MFVLFVTFDFPFLNVFHFLSLNFSSHCFVSSLLYVMRKVIALFSYLSSSSSPFCIFSAINLSSLLNFLVFGIDKIEHIRRSYVMNFLICHSKSFTMYPYSLNLTRSIRSFIFGEQEYKAHNFYSLVLLFLGFHNSLFFVCSFSIVLLF